MFRGNWNTGSEKMFEKFLPKMGVVAILVMWPRRRKQTNLCSPTPGGSTQNLALIGQAVSEMFEHCWRPDDGRTTEGRRITEKQ